ncbi:unnamed protein product [Orchesella dallaii]|uniref:Uncharacterized protein n=1 Tax=Orchesella dallaii TaxID=48710 RepID=A0ABP1RID2_9HEXA
MNGRNRNEFYGFRMTPLTPGSVGVSPDDFIRQVIMASAADDVNQLYSPRPPPLHHRPATIPEEESLEAAFPGYDVSGGAAVRKDELDSGMVAVQEPMAPPKKNIKQYRPALAKGDQAQNFNLPATVSITAVTSQDKGPAASPKPRPKTAAATATTVSASKAGREAESSKRKRKAAAREPEIQEQEAVQHTQKQDAATKSGEGRYNFRKRRN